MKKLLFSLVLAILTIGLVACGGGSEDASVEDVYNNALEAANNMESAEFTLDMEQAMEVPSADMTMDIKMNMEGSMIVDPLAMHQKGKLSIAMPGMGLGDEPMEMDMELYLQGDEMYLYEGMTGSWTKAPSTDLEALQGQTPDVTEQMELYKEYVEDFSMEESDGNYVLTLSADGDGVKELTETLMEETMSEDITSQLGDISQFLDNMEINNVDIEMVIDKETYDVVAQSVNMSITIDVEGEVLNLDQKMNMEFSNLNGVDSIEIPQEAKDAAL